jgi:hypothetical protein
MLLTSIITPCVSHLSQTHSEQTSRRELHTHTQRRLKKVASHTSGLSTTRRKRQVDPTQAQVDEDPWEQQLPMPKRVAQDG